jgi:branched-chain amino acid transport system permease protein
MIGGVIAAFVISLVISIAGYYVSIELSYVIVFVLFIVLILLRPQGILAK